MYACVGLLLASCADSSDGGGNTVLPTEEMAVSFSTVVGEQTQQQNATRATTGLIKDLDALKAMPEGFGVFAYPTENVPFNTTFQNKEVSTFSSVSNFFMQNQQVTWGVQYVENGDDANLSNDIVHRDWVYSPLKYWPNSSNNAENRNISFFAYAPYTAQAGATSGIINFTRDEDRTPHVIYKLGPADEQVDLLWANCIDATRNGNGLISVSTSGEPAVTTLTYQKVPLTFRHALAAIDIYVQRVYDEPVYTGKIPDEVLYPTIFISKLELKSTSLATDNKNGLQTSGKFSLIDGKWEDYDDPSTNEVDNTWTTGEVKLEYETSMLNDTIAGTTNTSEEYIRSIELDKWKWILDTKNTPSTEDDEWIDATTITDEEFNKPENKNRWKDAYGLSEVERNLIKNGVTQMLIPRKVRLIPTVTYSMVVRDDDMEIDYYTDSEGHRYDRIVNNVTGNSVDLDLQAGKRYTLLIRIGVEHITFEVVSVIDWDFPMRFTPDVITDFNKENIGHILNEE